MGKRISTTSSEFEQRRNPMTKSLAGKVALVTGGSRGIGAASARALADEGADVAISYSASADKAETVVRDLKAKGVRAKAFKADQADSGAVDDPNGDTSALDRQTAINFDAVVTAIRSASKLMTDGGRIVTIGSGIA